MPASVYYMQQGPIANHGLSGYTQSALSCATVLDVDFVKCPRSCVMAAL